MHHARIRFQFYVTMHSESHCIPIGSWLPIVNRLSVVNKLAFNFFSPIYVTSYIIVIYIDYARDICMSATSRRMDKRRFLLWNYLKMLVIAKTNDCNGRIFGTKSIGSLFNYKVLDCMILLNKWLFTLVCIEWFYWPPGIATGFKSKPPAATFTWGMLTTGRFEDEGGRGPGLISGPQKLMPLVTGRRAPSAASQSRPLPCLRVWTMNTSCNLKLMHAFSDQLPTQSTVLSKCFKKRC